VRVVPETEAGHAQMTTRPGSQTRAIGPEGASQVDGGAGHLAASATLAALLLWGSAVSRRLRPSTDKIAYGKLPRVTAWATVTFAVLLLSLSLHLPTPVLNAVYGGLLVSACVALVSGRAWLQTAVWNLVWRFRHR
jgi:hypothetical protein